MPKDNKILDLRDDKIKELESNDKEVHRKEFEARIERMEESSEYKNQETKEEKTEEATTADEVIIEEDKSSPLAKGRGSEAEEKHYDKDKKELKIKKSEIKEEKKINQKFDGSFSALEDIDPTISFPKGFIWGVSTSAYQVEGGIKNNWSEWEQSEKRKKKLEKKGLKEEDFICGHAVDSYNKWEEDLDLAQKLNVNTIRIGIEWSRIQPEKDTWNIGALDHYRTQLEGAKKKGFKTVVTLWHWTNPIWFENEKSWCNKESVEHFKSYTDMIVKELGGLIDFWVTLNEPMVPIFNGYLRGKFPPGKKYRFFKALKYFRSLVKAHKESYKIIHDYFPQSKVSITVLANAYEPARSWFFPEVLLAKISAYFSNYHFLNKIKKYIDYIGFDYYFHNRIIWLPPFKKNFNEETTDMGWEIYPEGIYQVLHELSKYKVPIYVMENGLADKNDIYRERFIKEHLYFVNKAIQDGVDVKGYFYWSLLDNFEWADGFAPKFGLYEVDRKTFERIPRPSAKIYTEICKNNGFKF